MLQFLVLLAFLGGVPSSEIHPIAKRALLFPRYTVLQFTYGVSAPLILRSRQINLSLAVQSNFDLPYNLSNFMTRIFQARSDNDFDRVTFYEYLVGILDGVGLAGRDCLLRSVCEIAEIPVQVEDSDSVLEKIVHYLFTPSQDLRPGGNETLADHVLSAEILGKSVGDCRGTYRGCVISLVDLFTAKIKLF